MPITGFVSPNTRLKFIVISNLLTHFRVDGLFTQKETGLRYKRIQKKRNIWMGLKRRYWDRLGNGGLKLTELGFGTAPIGNLYRAISDEDARATLDTAWDGGVRYFDTAPLYGLGLSETRLNPFLRSKPRKDYVLSTKVGRLMQACEPKYRSGKGKWFEVPQRREQFDYTYDGVMRSHRYSLCT
jgi:D-threo-aldose 1-dehydrogenase